MSHDESPSKRRRYRINRRRLLQLAGVGVGSLTMIAAGRSTARAEPGCANGPFERTYTAETVNISKVADHPIGHEKSDDPPSAAEGAFGKAKVDPESGSPPPASGAQTPPTSDSLLTVGTDYDGVRDTLIIEPPLEPKPIVAPSDAQIAAGRSKTVQAINQEIVIFNQRSGTIELEVPFERFFEPLITEDKFVIGKPIVADPRLRYDSNASRFVLSVFYMHFQSWSGFWLVAVSADRNPNGRWHLYRIGTHSGDWPDYPPLGLDRDAIYLTAETIPQSFAFSDFDLELAIVDKDAAYNGEEVSVSHFTDMLRTKGLQFVVQPAFQPFSGGESGPYYLMSSQFPDDQLTLWELSAPLDNPSLECHEINVDPYAPSPGARQPGTDLLIDTVEGRLMNLDYDDGSLWTAHSIRYNWNDGTDEAVAAIRWYEIDPVGRDIVQSGTYGEPGTSYFLPHICSDGGRTLMSYNVSGPETFPGIEVAGRREDFISGKMQESLVIREGESSMIHPTKFGEGPNPNIWWGDYMGISVHPTTGRFWMTGQYSPDYDVPPDGENPDRYQTYIAEVSFGDGKS